VVEVEKLTDCDLDCCGEYHQCVHGAGSVLVQSKFGRGQEVGRASEVDRLSVVQFMKLQNQVQTQTTPKVQVQDVANGYFGQTCT